MKQLSSVLFLVLISMLPYIISAQGTPKYQIMGVPFLKNGHPMQNPWVGGFNNPVFSPIDLNQDGLMDLFVYDKGGWKALSFINTGSVGHPSFTYDPSYDSFYPKGLLDWAVIRDYNHDGIGDIFALTQGDDIAVYKGYRNGNQLSYQLIYPHIMYTYGAGARDHVYTFADNIPVIMDVDGDGDIDILASIVGGGLTLNFYENSAVDNHFSSDSLSLFLEDDCWGRFQENSFDCNVSFDACKKDLPIDTTTAARHSGGACYGFHYRNDHVTDIILADIYCSTTKLLMNTGDSANAHMTSVDTLFPSYDVPVYEHIFPAAYGADVDNDGFEDLLFAPFASNEYTASQSQDVNVVHYYHNIGIDSVNKFHYEGDTLFNNGIVDVGTESHPVFFDYNGDGLLDIVAGNFGRFSQPALYSGDSGKAVSGLTLYKNVGADTMPIYEITDTNWNNILAYNLNGIYPAFGDLDGDGKPDMVVGEYNGNIEFFKNQGTSTLASYPSMTASNWFGINVGQNAAPFLYDVNGDGLLDLVIGCSGRVPSLKGTPIYYYWNFGTPTNPQFSPDSVNSFFGNAKVWDYHLGIVEGYATPTITKENGQLMLYSGCQRGLVLKYAINPDSLRSGTFALLDSDVLGTSPGLRSTVSIADINHDGKNDYLTGNLRGGLMLFSDTAWGPQLSTGITAPAIAAGGTQLEVYPNPAKDILLCRIGTGALHITSVGLYDMLGQIVTAHVNLNETNATVNVSGLPQGIYVIQATDTAGKLYKQKVAIVK